MKSCGIHLRTILQEVLLNLIHTMCSEIKLLKLLPLLPRANELTEPEDVEVITF